MNETPLDLNAIAEKHGLGWLMDPEDEHCHAEQLKAFASEIARRSATERWRWSAQENANCAGCHGEGYVWVKRYGSWRRVTCQGCNNDALTAPAARES